MQWTIDPACAVEARIVRRACVSRLESRAGANSDVGAASVILSELLGNAVEHGGAPIQLVLSWENGKAVAEVRDKGPGFESRHRVLPGPTALRGRGLYIVQELSEGLHVYRQDSGIVVRVRLPVRSR